MESGREQGRGEEQGLCALWLKFAARNLLKCLPFVVAFDNNGKYRINIISHLDCTSFLSCISYLSTFFVSLVSGMPFKCLLIQPLDCPNTFVIANWESSVYHSRKISLCLHFPALPALRGSLSSHGSCLLLFGADLAIKAQLLGETHWAYGRISAFCCICCAL